MRFGRETKCRSCVDFYFAGRCRDYFEPISIQYPVVELATGLLFGLMEATVGLNFVLPAFVWFVGVTWCFS